MKKCDGASRAWVSIPDLTLVGRRRAAVLPALVTSGAPRDPLTLSR
jgi:hypothetical protein